MTAPTLSLSDIQAAAARIEGHVLRTPMLHSRPLSKLTGAEIWVKYENLHYTASFKERGACNRLSQMSDDEKRRGVVAASAGNHASALAYHGQRLGIPVTIVMPQGTPFVKIEKTESFGATVVIEGSTFDDATVHAHMLRDTRGYIFVSAFDDIGIVTGQGTCGLEMLTDQPDLDAIVVPIGGGGLIAGCATAGKALSPDLDVYGVEAAMYPSFMARRRGERACKTQGSTLAEGIAIKAVGDIPFAIADPLVDEVLVVDEEDFEKGVAFFATVGKTVAEGAGAGGLAAVLRFPERFKGRKVGLVLAGGNIDPRMLASVLQREMVREHRMVTYRIVADDRPGVLAAMTAAIAGRGGNIIDVVHNRLALDVPAKGAEYDIMIETRDDDHADAIAEALRKEGYAVRMG
jgi:threonine dehydratase